MKRLQIAFQFSHHQVEKDGSISHKDEYISRAKGEFPNFNFVRALMLALSNDDGTIFRYAAHENTVLCQIRQQLVECENRPSDFKALVEFIDSVTTSNGADGNPIVGNRNMVDLCELVKRYFYDPQMKGSNSIKKVLPAILNSSSFLQAKYSTAAYGSKSGIKSRNFNAWTWINRDSMGKVIDPYKLLPAIFSDLDLEEMDALITDGNIADGGAAMTAYSRMQFTEMSESEFKKVESALLKYCELDTFAMVLIYEYWKSEIDRIGLGRAA